MIKIPHCSRVKFRNIRECSCETFQRAPGETFQSVFKRYTLCRMNSKIFSQENYFRQKSVKLLVKLTKQSGTPYYDDIVMNILQNYFLNA